MNRTRVVFTAAFALMLVVVAPVQPARADEVRAAQWHLTTLDIARAQQVSQGEGVTVAVIDSGINGNHPDLVGNVLHGVTLVPGRTGDGWEDIDFHGTAMAGLVAAHGRGSEGALGIAPRAKILPVQVESGREAANPDRIASAIDTAVQRGARVISLSLATTGGSPQLQVAVEAAQRADIVVVAGVGNLPRDQSVSALASYDGVVAAAAVDRNGNHAAVSVTGPHVVISAPGEHVECLDVHNGYVSGTGTSASTAIVAGVAALVRAKYPKMSAVDVVHRLTTTATDKGPTGRDDQYGYGIVNPYAALTADVPAVSASASPGMAPPASQPAAAPSRAGGGTVLLVGVGALVVIAGVVVMVLLGVRRRTATG